MKSIVNNIDLRTLLEFVLTVLFGVAGYKIGGIETIRLQATVTHIPPVVIETLQCIMYLSAAVTAFFAGHSWWKNNKKKKEK